MGFFGPDFQYQDRATDSIQQAKEKWPRIEDIVNSIEWAIVREPYTGELLNETGLRGFVYHGAKSIHEPDVGVLYRIDDQRIIVEDLLFREARSHYAGKA